MSTSSQTQGSAAEQLVFCEKRIKELEEQNFKLLEEIRSNDDESKLYIVHLIRYGNLDRGVYFYGVFDSLERVHIEMRIHNNYRGGKYPEYYVTETVLNPKDQMRENRVRYSVYKGKLEEETK